MSIRREDLDDLDLTDLVEPGAGRIAPIHPGTTLLEDYLRPLGMSAYALARAIEVPPNRISEIVKGRREITADTALRLARYFGTDAQSWLNLQTAFDLCRARADLAGSLERIRPRAA
ncbi:HigA family addiction module antitoxin [Rhodocista pekingensis]|uniref:HigA family addiction module antitoxin n=1 Tax=Rhodocista pekingensis TaxID=201185 RepID=A0ABW2KPK6_9PROT